MDCKSRNPVDGVALKGTPSKDTSWSENVENVQIFLVAGFVVVLLSTLTQHKYLSAKKHLNSLLWVVERLDRL